MPKKYKYQTTFTYDGKRYIVRADTKAELYTKRAKKLNALETNQERVCSAMTVRAWYKLRGKF